MRAAGGLYPKSCPECGFGPCARKIASPPLALQNWHVDTTKPNDFGRLLDASARRRIIGFTGLAGSGKSTAADRLITAHGWQRVRFSGPLKAMLAALGLTDAEIEGDRKEVPCELLCGRTPRHAMITIGTEWGRDLIGPDLWVRAWRAAVDRMPAGVPVVVEDVRFENEAAAVRAAGGVVVRVVRPGTGQIAAGHVSEAGVVTTGPELVNDGSIATFLAQVDALVTAD
jgi:hypothetical protein